MALPRLRERYEKDVVPFMMGRFGYTNRLGVPRLVKVTLNMGVGRATENPKRLDAAAGDLARIAGQKPVVTKAKKSVAGFKLREGQSIGCKVTLRGNRMYEFLDRLISITIPRIRDFRGFPRSSFDGRGNYTLGLTEQTVFPEVELDSVEFVQGMDVTLSIINSNDEASAALLEQFGFPFRR
ncbi:MAG TPA: 50S ribosomal protein L5 [Planctomycetes bacterium]|jgi:large subunit ribosomal protein L5|nr:50S ribosomal protein L5 [Planctomycetota bacterium]